MWVLHAFAAVTYGAGIAAILGDEMLSAGLLLVCGALLQLIAVILVRDELPPRFLDWWAATTCHLLHDDQHVRYRRSPDTQLWDWHCTHCGREWTTCD